MMRDHQAVVTAPHHRRDNRKRALRCVVGNSILAEAGNARSQKDAQQRDRNGMRHGTSAGKVIGISCGNQSVAQTFQLQISVAAEASFLRSVRVNFA